MRDRRQGSNHRTRRSSPSHRPAAFALASATVFAALAWLAAPAAAAQLRVDPSPSDGVKVITMTARVHYVDGRRTADFEIGSGGHVPLVAGDRVRIHMVGTAIEGGRGVERVIPVRFQLSAGSRWADASQDRDGSVLVVAKPVSPDDAGTDGLVNAQLSYAVLGDYDMRDHLRNGFVTFSIRPARGSVGGPVTGSGRWQRAASIGDDVAEIQLAGEGTPNWVVERIYRNGYQGARDAALELAVQTERTGVLRRWTPQALTAHLYRHLLGRPGSDREIALADRGFDANVRIYQSRGYRALVEVFVDSDEFRRHHDFARIENLPMPRDDRGQGNDPDQRRRPRPRGNGGWHH